MVRVGLVNRSKLQFKVPVLCELVSNSAICACRLEIGQLVFGPLQHCQVLTVTVLIVPTCISRFFWFSWSLIFGLYWFYSRIRRLQQVRRIAPPSGVDNNPRAYHGTNCQLHTSEAWHESSYNKSISAMSFWIDQGSCDGKRRASLKVFAPYNTIQYNTISTVTAVVIFRHKRALTSRVLSLLFGATV